ncbi:hypothetical protein [Thiocapsa roseopersicina]|nr:hypothetical protein [Thiocapsa roseopersicina]
MNERRDPDLTDPNLPAGTDGMASAIHNRVELAAEQLDIALELFLNGRSDVSVLTLAGAAEEILGRSLERVAKQTTLQWEYAIIAPFEDSLMRRPLEWKVFIKEKNRVRNAAKHMPTPDEMKIEADLKEEALRLLVRAYDNYRRLDLQPTERMEEFHRWFYTNALGFEDDPAYSFA